MNVNNQPYSTLQSSTTVAKASVGRTGAPQNIELGKVESDKGYVRQQDYPQDNKRQQTKANKESLSASEYELVAAAHQKSQTIYDQPQGNQRLAISSYQSVLHAPKREEIQRLVGIDTFA